MLLEALANNEPENYKALTEWKIDALPIFKGKNHEHFGSIGIVSSTELSEMQLVLLEEARGRIGDYLQTHVDAAEYQRLGKNVLRTAIEPVGYNAKLTNAVLHLMSFWDVKDGIFIYLKDPPAEELAREEWMKIEYRNKAQRVGHIRIVDGNPVFDEDIEKILLADSFGLCLINKDRKEANYEKLDGLIKGLDQKSKSFFSVDLTSRNYGGDSDTSNYKIGRLIFTDSPHLSRLDKNAIDAATLALEGVINESLRIRARLGLYLNQDHVDFFADNPEIEREFIKTPRIMTVTPMFIDLRGSTALGEKYDMMELSDVICRALNTVAEYAQALGIQVDNYLGDGILLEGGSPFQDAPMNRIARVKNYQELIQIIENYGSPQHEIVSKCMEFALSIPHIVEHFTIGDEKLQVTIGMETGNAVMKNQKRTGNPTFISPTINRAARIQGIKRYSVTDASYNIDDTVLVGEGTAEQLGKFLRIGNFSKGPNVPVAVWPPYVLSEYGKFDLKGVGPITVHTCRR